MEIINACLIMSLVFFANSSVSCDINQSKERAYERSRVSKSSESFLEAPDSCRLCDIAIWISSFSDSVDDTPSESVSEMICTIDKSCSDNEEFSSISNEFLFILLRDFPVETLKAITLKAPNIQLYILEQLENPIHDGVDLQTTIEQLSKVQEESVQSIKTQVLNSITIASEK